MKTIKTRRTNYKEMFVLGVLVTAVACSSMTRTMTLELWCLLITTTIMSMAVSAAAAGRNNRRWFVVSALAVVLFLILLGLRIPPWP